MEKKKKFHYKMKIIEMEGREHETKMCHMLCYLDECDIATEIEMHIYYKFTHARTTYNRHIDSRLCTVPYTTTVFYGTQYDYT